MRKLFLIIAIVLFTLPAYADDGYGKTRGLLGPVLFGPELAIINFPPSVGLELKVWGYIGASVEYGMVPRLNYSRSEGKLSGEFHNWNAGLKVYPFGGRFFLGIDGGRYTFSLNGSGVKDGDLYAADLTASTLYYSPSLGWLISWESGFFMKFKLGWMFPLNFKSTLTVTSGASAGDVADAKDKINQWGDVGLPILGFFRVGCLF